MTSPQFSGTDWYGLSAAQPGLVVSLSLGGALLGSGEPREWELGCMDVGGSGGGGQQGLVARLSVGGALLSSGG